MPLLLLPLLVAALVLLWLLLWPFALWQRYRMGRARRRAVAWVAGLNAWMLLVSACVFLLGAWLTGHWVEAALAHATAGVALGVLLGCIGLLLTRFEATPQGLYYTPNRWLVLALTLVVAVRIAYGLYRMEQAWVSDAHGVWLSQQGSVLAVGGVLLGHYLAYAWGLRSRLRRAA
ncbi:hypothetical protein J2X04_002946 [Lysobacter niabensis]|uniref:DUF1453 domain-containing protein n=1 Tax=Agrilutibacter niabensis TaxID=380628 RepID=A0ABU1VT94_9GAMM|nr:DUF1453 domain-containing protein [Lysobacter niabensis]MDR7100565.1 hypothetical protein [Lysobacter niabensis]